MGEIENASWLLATLRSSPYITFFTFSVLLVLSTRIITGYLNYQQERNADHSEKIPILPYWFPYIGHALDILRSSDDLATRGRNSTSHGIFGLQMFGAQHYVVLLPSLVKQYFVQRPSALTGDDFLHWVFKNYFGDGGASAKLSPDDFHASHRTLTHLMNEPFLSDATVKTRRAVEIQVPQIISSPSTQQANPGAHGKSLDVDLYSFIINFVGGITGEILMGEAFCKNNPEILQDMWTFDDAFHSLLSGFPGLTSTGRTAIQARDRLIRAVKDFHQAVVNMHNGNDNEHKWADLSDVSEIMKYRLKVYQDLKIDDGYAVSADMSLYWGLMANANKLIYWMIISIASSPTLLASIQAEIKAFAKVNPGSTTLELDDEGLLGYCPILKATFFETLRVYTSGTSYKKVLQDLTLKESEEDAKTFGRPTPKTYNIKAGHYLIIYHGTMQMDPRLWGNPETFDPHRFLVADEKNPGELKADKLHLNAFGGGSTICKGRNYAEREVLIFVAGLLAVYDFSPVGSEWEIPGKYHNGTGTAKPTSSPRVRMSRRA